jgi:hypothetical protein
MLIGSMVQHQLGDDAQAAAMRLFQKILEIPQRSVGGMDAVVVGNIVAVVAPG